jgi:hypothetical protein
MWRRHVQSRRRCGRRLSERRNSAPRSPCAAGDDGGSATNARRSVHGGARAGGGGGAGRACVPRDALAGEQSPQRCPTQLVPLLPPPYPVASQCLIRRRPTAPPVGSLACLCRPVPSAGSNGRHNDQSNPCIEWRRCAVRARRRRRRGADARLRPPMELRRRVGQARATDVAACCTVLQRVVRRCKHVVLWARLVQLIQRASVAVIEMGVADERASIQVGSPPPHLHRDRAHCCHICTGTGLTAATSAPGLAWRMSACRSS